MTKQDIIDSLVDVIKVLGIHLGAIAISFSDVAEWLKVISLSVATGYTLWKWREEYKKTKKKNGTTHK